MIDVVLKGSRGTTLIITTNATTTNDAFHIALLVPTGGRRYVDSPTWAVLGH